jgi:hypothetical protein
MPRNIFGLNPHYQFRDQDPVFDQMRTILKASGLNHQQLAERTHMCRSTFDAWFTIKSTHSPRHESVQIFYRAFGIEYGARSNLRVVVAQAKKARRAA